MKWWNVCVLHAFSMPNSLTSESKREGGKQSTSKGLRGFHFPDNDGESIETEADVYLPFYLFHVLSSPLILSDFPPSMFQNGNFSQVR